MATNTEVKNFIKLLGALAVAECNRRIANGQGFVLPSVCIAQSALETGWGTAGIMTRANAFFGIKAGGSWTGKIYVANTREVAPNGQEYNIVANFRAYDNLEDSVADYYNLITGLSRYANGVSYGADKSKWKTARETITALWAGGYATDTIYVQEIMNTINARDLTSYDDLVDGINTTPLEITNFNFTGADMKQGTLTPADSNRTYANDTSITDRIALDWSKAFTPKVNTTYKITGITGLIMTPRIIRDNLLIMGNVDYENDSTIELSTNMVVGFELRHKDGGNITPSDLNNISITSRLEGDELQRTALAFFIKIQ